MLSGYACCLAQWESPKILCPCFRTRFLLPSMTQCQLLVVTNCQCDTFPPLPPLHIFPVPMFHTPYIGSHHDLVHTCFYPRSEEAILCHPLSNKSLVRGLLHGMIFGGIPWDLMAKMLFHHKTLSPAVCQRRTFHSAKWLCLQWVPEIDLLQCYLAQPVFFLVYMILSHAILSFFPCQDSITTSILQIGKLYTLSNFT